MNSSTSSSTDFSSASTGATSASDKSSATRAVASKVSRVAGEAIDQAKDKAAQFADENRGVAADKLGGYSSALRRSAQDAATQQDPNIAHLANQAADRLEQVAGYVRNTDIGQLQRDASDIARRHPALFMGGLFVAGLVIGNLAKASVQSLNENDDVNGADDDDTEAYEHGDDLPDEPAYPAAGVSGANEI